ncbi:MAG: hypothetical protein F6K16_42915 [Symploca sp. SIO2B6]|nr:hypothetical protein [Symploca sp. SIO2B6]
MKQRTFLTQWITATVIGYLAIGFDLAYPPISIVLFIGSGLWVSLLQWLVLRQVLQDKPHSQDVFDWVHKGWRLAMIGLFFSAVIIVFSLIFASDPKNPDGRIWLLSLSLYPLFFSIGQWRFLRHFSQRSAWWIVVGFVSISLGWLSAITTIWIFHTRDLPLFLGGIASGGIGGLLQGGISGIGLVYLLKFRK